MISLIVWELVLFSTWRILLLTEVLLSLLVFLLELLQVFRSLRSYLCHRHILTLRQCQITSLCHLLVAGYVASLCNGQVSPS